MLYFNMDKLPTNQADFSPRPEADGRSVTVSAPAKINLFLKVTGRRPDGYHNIFSWFQALDLRDELIIEKTAGDRIAITTDHDLVPTGPENLVYQAAQAVKERYDIPGGLRIYLKKRIPVGAGLGGGSSDAAATIKGLNRLFGLDLDAAEMSQIGLSIGSDVPFFFSRGQAEVTGRGEIVKNIELPVDYEVALVTPPFQIRAAEAYRKLRLDLTASFLGVKFNSCRQATELFGIISEIGNDLEPALRVSYPILDKVDEKLKRFGADIVRLSGSGPTLFALLGNGKLSEKVLKDCFRGEEWGAVVTRPIVLPA